MSKMPQIPRGCFAVTNWNGEVLVCDPRSKIENLCRVLVYRRDDLRVRVVGTYAPRAGKAQLATLRLLVDGAGIGEYQEFDTDYVSVVRIVSVHQPETQALTKNRDRVVRSK